MYEGIKQILKAAVGFTGSGEQMDAAHAAADALRTLLAKIDGEKN